MKEACEFQEKLFITLKPREVGMDITTAQLTEIFQEFLNGLFKRYKTFFLHQEIAKEEMHIIFNRFSTLKKKVEVNFLVSAQQNRWIIVKSQRVEVEYWWYVQYPVHKNN